VALYFEWDPGKARRNLEKHRVSFELARLVFVDPFTETQADLGDGGEERWVTTGFVGIHLLVVVHCDREYTDARGARHSVVRIISARKATRHERETHRNYP
jgi:uncharacterized DUF497 family protein